MEIRTGYKPPIDILIECHFQDGALINSVMLYKKARHFPSLEKIKQGCKNYNAHFKSD